MQRPRSTIVIIALILLAIAGVAAIVLSTRETNKNWRNMKGRVLLQLMPATHKDNIPDLLWKPFIQDVDIGVVMDDEKQYHFIQRANLDAWNITEDMLFEQARKNLEAISRNIKVEVAQATENDPKTKYVIVELDDGYAAARIISENVRAAIARELGDEYVAAIPTRDFLIFWHKDFPLFDAFAGQVEAEYRAEEDYPLTPTILFVDKNGVQEMVKNSL